MSAHAETRFSCDRCSREEIVPMQNVPAPARIAGPQEWLLLRISDDPSKPPSHLCPHCSAAFMRWMHAFPADFPADA